MRGKRGHGNAMLTTTINRLRIGYKLQVFNLEMNLRQRVRRLRHALALRLLRWAVRLRHVAFLLDATALTEGPVHERHPYRSTSRRYKWR